MRSVRGCKRTPISVEQAREWWDAVQGGQTTWKEIARANRMSIMWAFERSRGVLGIKVRGYTSRISEDAARKEYELCVAGKKKAREAASQLGVSWMTLNSVWSRYGFDRLPHSGGSYEGMGCSVIPTKELRSLHEAVASGNITLKELRSLKGSGYTPRRMQKLWKKEKMTNPCVELRKRKGYALLGGTK